MALGPTQPLLEGEGGQCVELTTLPPPCANCVDILTASTFSNSRACPDQYRDSFTFANEVTHTWLKRY